ncbi:MAG: hypothetical protein WCZ99_02335 [Candidatus Paceibacterota bacterium]|nr:hypothetical protein [Candidatus Paceibacterota bacterium]
MKKKNFKKLILPVVLFLLSSPFILSAAPPIPAGRTITGLWNAIRNLANWLFSFLAIVSVIGVVISAYMFVTSGGEPGKVASARQIMIYSLVGVMIGGFALVLVNFIAGLAIV